MPDYPNPNDLDGALMMLGALFCLILAGLLWIDAWIERRQERERQAVEDLRAQAGAEAYVHHDRCN